MPAPRGFARVEAALLLVIAVVAAALLLAGGMDTRRRARLASDLSNLGRIGALGAAYAADHRDLIWGFSWIRGRNSSRFPDLQNAADDMDAAACQAVDAIKRLADVGMPRIHQWYAPLWYGHLPLAEYAGLPFLSPIFVSSADHDRQNWARDPAGFNEGRYLPCQPPPGGFNRRWPYSASYQSPPANWDADQPPLRVSQDGFPFVNWAVPNGKRTGRAWSEVAFPAHKVMYHDEGDRHHSRVGLLFIDESARVPVLMGDASAAVRATRDANPGWRPNFPTDPSPTVFQAGGAPPPTCHALTVSGPMRLLPAVYRFTRAGLAGIDFGGPEPHP